MFPVKSIMTSNVITVTQQTPIYEAMEKLANHRISGLPVVDDTMHLIGILSEFDVLEILTAEDIASRDTVGHYMTKYVSSYEDTASALDIAEFFMSTNKRMVPITHEGKLVGVISRHDIVKLILQARGNILKK